MAEVAQNIPQFKLVLVGDGGTGKVSTFLLGDFTIFDQLFVWRLQSGHFVLHAILLADRNL